MHLVFVYGTLKKGYRNHTLLRGSKFLGEFQTATKLRLYTNGIYPMIVRDETGYPVSGELYEVDNDTLKNLHRLEGVPFLYDCAAVELEGFSDPQGRDVNAYIYQREVHRYVELEHGCWPAPKARKELAAT